MNKNYKIIDEFLKNNHIDAEDFIDHLVFYIKGKFGFDIKVGELEYESAIVVSEEKQEKIIIVNKNLDYKQQRFAIFREFTHYILAEDKSLVAHKHYKGTLDDSELERATIGLIVPKDRRNYFERYYDYWWWSHIHCIDMNKLVLLEK